MPGVLSSLYYQRAPGEAGPIVDYSYPVAWSPRYGAGQIGSENSGANQAFFLNTMLPNTQPVLTAGRGDGHSYDAHESGSRTRVNGYESIGIVHPIGGGGDGARATATGTMTGGVLTATAVTHAGNGSYFHAPQVSAVSSGGGAMLNGQRLKANMVPATIKRIVHSLGVADGGGFTANQILPLQNDVEVKVLTVDAAGLILTAELHAFPTMDDPTLGTVANRYFYGDTFDAATAWFLIGFNVDSLTILEGGTGGSSAVKIYIEQPSIYDVSREGEEVCWARFGIQNCKRFSFGTIRAKSDPAINADEQGQPGMHIDWASDGDIKAYICEATQQTGSDDHNAYAALAIDGNGGDQQARRIRFGLVDLSKCAFHGAALTADTRIEVFRCHSFGQADVRTALPYSGPATQKAAALYCYRGTPDIGRTELNQDIEGMGDTAAYHLLFASTGLQNVNMDSVPPHDPEDRWATTEDVSGRPATMGPIIARNVCRRGLAFVDPDHNNESNPCHVHVSGDIVLQYSAVEPMEEGFLEIAWNGETKEIDWPGISVNLGARDTALSVSGKIMVLNSNGAAKFVGETFTGRAPHHFYAAPGTRTDIHGGIEDMAHSNGMLALIENGADIKVEARSKADDGKPYSGLWPLVWVNNPEPMGNVQLDADCSNLNQQRAGMWVKNLNKARVGARMKHYRNVDAIVIDGGENAKVMPLYLEGVASAKNAAGLSLKPPMTNVGFEQAEIFYFDKGVKVASGSITDCTAINCRAHDNNTNTQIPSSAMAALASSTFAP